MDPIEHATRAEITALQERLLRAQVEHAFRTPFYAKRWRAAGIDPGRLRTLADLRQFPIITKADIDADLEENPPFGSYQGTALAARIHASSGITGNPRPIFCTLADCNRIAQLSARRLRAQGVQPGDVIQVTLPFALYIGGAIVIEGAREVGATVIPTGTGAMTPTQRQIEIAFHWRPTVLCATPSYSLRLAEVAEEMGHRPERDFAIRLVYVTAETVTPELRRQISARWNCRVFDNYGSVEAAASTFECSEQSGWHISEDAYIFETVDQETGEPVGPGEDGVLLITSLFREAAPFIRYKVGDIVSLTDEPCACGRTLRRMSSVKGRADEMLKLRGVSVYPTAIEHVLRSFPELGLEWQLALEGSGPGQRIVVEVEASAALPGAESAVLAGKVAEGIRTRIGILPEVKIFAPGELAPERPSEQQVKRRRVVQRF